MKKIYYIKKWGDLPQSEYVDTDVDLTKLGYSCVGLSKEDVFISAKNWFLKIEENTLANLKDVHMKLFQLEELKKEIINN